MSKSDDFIKERLRSINDIGNLKRRVFLGDNNSDQMLWADGGLTFGYNAIKYGSCDFAWYVEEEWIDPFNNKKCKAKPAIVIEGTDCLNTRSWGNAQIQRFHHVLGAAICGITGVYYLNKGEHEIRPYLFASAFFASKIMQKNNKNSRYLILDEIKDLAQLARIAGKYGMASQNFSDFCQNLEDNMMNRFNLIFKRDFSGNWTKYLESRDIFKTKIGWVKLLGPDLENFTNSSKRMGHIVVGEAFTSAYLLMGSNKIRDDEKFYYLLPLMQKEDVDYLNRTKSSDKEWALLTKKDNPWNLLALDEINGISDRTIKRFENLKGTNRNHAHVRKELNAVKSTLINELK